MVFKFRPGHSLPVEAQIVGERLEEIRGGDDGMITPADVIEDARPEDSPLHPCFTWNNKEAAEKYREDEARALIRSVEVVTTDDETGDETRQIAFVSVARPFVAGPAYTSTTNALSDDEMRGRVMDECRRQLRGLQNRYQHIRECASAIQLAIDELSPVPV